MRIKNISFFALFALFLVLLGFCHSNEDFSENLGVNSSADFSKDFDNSSQVFALSNFDKKLLENGSLQGYVVSEKLDGIRALWDGANLKSRSGKAFSPPKCWVENLPDFALDGELFIARGKFEEVLSVVSKGDSQCEECKCEEWSKVGYFIFDVPQEKSNAKSSADSSTDFSAKSYTLLERLALLESWLENRSNQTNKASQAKTTKAKNSADLDSAKESKNPILRIIPQESVSSLEALQAKLKEVEKLGGEGLVIRKNNAPYERFRTTNAMKLKSYSDTECVVVAHNQGKGKFSHALGSLTCESLPLDFATTKITKGAKNADSALLTSIDSAQPNKIKDSTNSTQSTPLTFHTHSRKIRFKIGSGFSDKDRASPPPIGTIITYKYYGLTKKGLPRFPVFLRVYSP